MLQQNMKLIYHRQGDRTNSIELALVQRLVFTDSASSGLILIQMYIDHRLFQGLCLSKIITIFKVVCN